VFEYRILEEIPLDNPNALQLDCLRALGDKPYTIGVNSEIGFRKS